MDKRIFFILTFPFLMLALNSCYVDHEYYEPYVELVNVEEYETKEVIYQEYNRGQLVYEEAVFEAWMDIEISNSGGEPAREVKIAITVHGDHTLYHDFIYVGWLSPGEYTTLSYYTGFAYSSDYNGYDIDLSWE